MILEVLIVDDDKVIQLVHKKMILKSDFHPAPLTFMNGRETLDYMLNNNVSDKTCCVLLDINMPVMNGWEFLEALTQHTILAQVFVFIITSSVDMVDKEKAKSYLNVHGFLEKPIDLNTLQQLKNHPALKISLQ